MSEANDLNHLLGYSVVSSQIAVRPRTVVGVSPNCVFVAMSMFALASPSNLYGFPLYTLFAFLFIFPSNSSRELKTLAWLVIAYCPGATSVAAVQVHPVRTVAMRLKSIVFFNFINSYRYLTIKLTGGQKRSFWASSERSERQLSALLCSHGRSMFSR